MYTNMQCNAKQTTAAAPSMFPSSLDVAFHMRLLLCRRLSDVAVQIVYNDYITGETDYVSGGSFTAVETWQSVCSITNKT